MDTFPLSIRSGGIALLTAVLTFFAPVAFSSGASSEIRSVEGAPFISTKAEELVMWRSSPGVRNTVAVTFMPLPESALTKLQEENSQELSNGLRTKALLIGVNRNADTEIRDAAPIVLNWKSIGDGHIARWAVTSPDARGLRVALRLRALPDNAEMRFSGSAEPERIIGVISGKEANALRDDDRVYWTPVTEGETQNIEIWLPSTVNPEDVNIRLNGVSHLFTSAQDGFDTAHLVKASEACQINVVCRSTLGANFQNTSTAVAKMTYTSGGGSYMCTGTLLNDTSSSFTPYFWSAAHCFTSQTVANTLNTHWFYEAAACSGRTPGSNYQQRTGGATVLHARVATDTLLVRLNNAPPSGVWLAGWNAERFSSGNITAIHHPSGDIKKVSFGKGEGRTCDTVFSGASEINRSTLAAVSWQEGSTEGGSSGSGLFTISSNGGYQLRGGLMGGAANCSNVNRPVANGNVDCYSGLDQVWNDIKQYLSPATQPQYGPSHNYTGQWHNPNESGWGLSIFMGFQGQPRLIFAPWFTYDGSGRPSWYIFQHDVWSANDKITANVLRFSGPNWGSTYPRSATSTVAGTATLTFTSATAARIEYNVDGASRTVNLTKMP
ncbi:MAG: hypothetical protein FWC38_06630 [Proteobacteria bacterium]|nr:hypothetical protein [Pseudomonadota bacterium]MCL2307881.1 hypothetical protein [Pseudomonadota bacterium]